jgi:hypothetical protein
VSAQGAQRATPTPAWWNLTGHIAAVSRAGGAAESGLTRLIWAQVLSFAGDATITVALAGTAFFSAAHSQQKLNVLGYLLITMVPFGLIAPFIGPALDRLSRARRTTMAATGFGRAALAVLMALNFDTVFVLFPLALGSLVLSKSYGIVRASATSRVTPRSMTLVAANSRLSVFGLGSSALAGGLMAVFLRLTQWYPAGLGASAVVFLVAGGLALQLPRVLDAPAPATQPTDRAGTDFVVGNGSPTEQRARFRGPLATALRGESALRAAAGFLTIFLAFHIEQTSRGLAASAAFAGVVLGSGLGQLLGTVTGSRIRTTHPQRLIMGGLGVCSIAFIIPAAAFSLPIAIGCAAISSLTNSLGKVSLDSIIQQQMPRALVSRGFARSETILQLAWVAGAILALLLPTQQPRLAFSAAASALLAATAFLVVHGRRHPR